MRRAGVSTRYPASAWPWPRLWLQALLILRSSGQDGGPDLGVTGGLRSDQDRLPSCQGGVCEVSPGLAGFDLNQSCRPQKACFAHSIVALVATLVDQR